VGISRYFPIDFSTTRVLGVSVVLASNILIFGSVSPAMAEEGGTSATATMMDAASAAKDMLGTASDSAAEMVSEVTGVDVAALQEQIDATRAAMQELQQDQQSLAEQLSSAQQKVEDLEAARNEVEGQLADKENELGSTKMALADTESQRDASQREVEKLQSDITDLGGENDRLVSELADLKATLSDREQRIDSLQQLLPAGEGGTVTTDQAREETIKAQQLLAEPGTSDQAALEEARTLIRRNQFLLGYAEGARGVYLTKPGDSLSLVSAYFYAEGKYWKDILQANQHLLENPDQLESGMTLIIP